MPTDKLVSQVNTQLKKFADGLQANEAYLEEGISLCEYVSSTLEHACKGRRFSITSSHYGVSTENGTAVENIELDIVIQVTNQKPPFTDVLGCFEKALKRNSYKLRISQSSLHLSRFGIQFSYTNGMSVNVLIAMEGLTVNELLLKMAIDPRKGVYYSSSFVESQLTFMKEQSASAHAVARLASYWYKSMKSRYHMSGGSTIFELLAVAADIRAREDYVGVESMYHTFLRVVSMVEQLDTLKLAFELSKNGAWGIRALPVQGHRTPYLLASSNTTNNLIDGLTDQVINMFKYNARCMRNRLDALMKAQRYCCPARDEIIEIQFDRLFCESNYFVRLCWGGIPI